MADATRTTRGGEFAFHLTREAGHYRLVILSTHRATFTAYAFTGLELDALRDLLRDPSKRAGGDA